MLKPSRLPPFLLAASLSLGTLPASAATIDGKLDPDYGPALSVQSTQTSQADNAAGQLNLAEGSELDAGFGYIANGTLYLFIAGNATFLWTIEGTTLWLPVDIFIDSTPGGQNTLLPNNPTIEPSTYDAKKMAGLTFDAGFEADYWLSFGGDLGSWPTLKAFYAELPTGGGGSGVVLGGTLAGGPGTLSGGTNPFGILATADLSNTAGVTAGCGAASGAGVTTGIEWAIPLAAVGNPTECIKVCAFASAGDHSALFNQVLGPVPSGTCNLGAASTVNLAVIPGSQFFTICPAPTPTRGATWGQVKTIYR